MVQLVYAIAVVHPRSATPDSYGMMDMAHHIGEFAMHRTTIMLPDKLKLQVQARAREHGISLSEFIRSALEQTLEKSNAGVSTDPLFGDSEVFDGASPQDLASHHDNYLYGDDGS